jgi:hypothetical protein
MSIRAHNFDDTAAVVTRPPVRRHDDFLYMRITDDGVPSWTADPETATAFGSMREATRAALRLPGGLHAFSLPLRTEITAHDLH